MTCQSKTNSRQMRFIKRARRQFAAGVLLFVCSAPAMAQDVRWSWFEISYIEQAMDEQGTMIDFASQQTVEADAQDGSGIKFRASLGTWHNLFAFIDFNSTDNDVDVVVTNPAGVFPASDQYDYTAIRGGIGAKWAITDSMDIYGAVSYDSTDFDFGSFAGENFDAGDKDVGGQVGMRWMVGDQFEVRAHARYTGVGTVDLSTGILEEDTLFGVGFGYELVRGLSLIGDYESGEFSNWNIGFRLDLSED